MRVEQEALLDSYRSAHESHLEVLFGESEDEVEDNAGSDESSLH